jgi:hypothetical protein
MSPDPTYYLLINNVPHGPYTGGQVQDWINSQSSESDLTNVVFAIAGSSNWQSIRSFSVAQGPPFSSIIFTPRKAESPPKAQVLKRIGVLLIGLSICCAYPSAKFAFDQIGTESDLEFTARMQQIKKSTPLTLSPMLRAMADDMADSMFEKPRRQREALLNLSIILFLAGLTCILINTARSSKIN